MIEQRITIPFNSDRLSGVLAEPISYGKRRRLAIMLHGGPGGEKDGPDNLYLELAKSLAATGIASFRFDFRGSGESTGLYRDMTVASQTAEYLAVLDFLGGHFKPDSMGTIGESYGATIALVGYTNLVSAMCLLWPAIYLLDKTFASYVTPEKLERARQHGFIVEEEQQVGLAFLEEILALNDVSYILPKIKSPTLLVHGDTDNEVPFEQSKRAEKLLSSTKKRLILIPGGDHCCRNPNERAIIYPAVTAWFDEHL
jgi:uncharacterized protein